MNWGFLGSSCQGSGFSPDTKIYSQFDGGRSRTSLFHINQEILASQV